jgi:hypothetical protein
MMGYKFSLVAAAAAALILWRLKRRRRNSDVKITPMLETFREMTSSRAPWFLLEQSRLLGPVYRVSFQRK